jgi:hypothetical protein
MCKNLNMSHQSRFIGPTEERIFNRVKNLECLVFL